MQVAFNLQRKIEETAVIFAITFGDTKSAEFHLKDIFKHTVITNALFLYVSQCILFHVT